MTKTHHPTAGSGQTLGGTVPVSHLTTCSSICRGPRSRLLLLAFAFGFSCLPARADVVLLLEEPINTLGRVTSSGHATLLLEGLCSDDHLHMRVCNPGEPGSVVGRYDGIGTYDWLAIQPLPYLYAADRVEAIPASMSREELETMRESYRVANLQHLVPKGGDGLWIQLIGASYRRRIIGVHVRTTREQDLRLMTWLNARNNTSHFNLFYENCADFTRMMLNVLYPGAIHRNLFFDAAITTPKQLVSGLHGYAMRHPELGWDVMLLLQVPGDVRRSGKMYGVTEAFVKTKPYLLPLVIIQPAGIGTVAFSGLCDRRYNIHQAMVSAPRLTSADIAAGHEFSLQDLQPSSRDRSVHERTAAGDEGN